MLIYVNLLAWVHIIRKLVMLLNFIKTMALNLLKKLMLSLFGNKNLVTPDMIEKKAHKMN